MLNVMLIVAWQVILFLIDDNEMNGEKLVLLCNDSSGVCCSNTSVK